jgi:murein DD-endopeptidase MepM/ murein hydrolase activator NlpD
MAFHKPTKTGIVTCAYGTPGATWAAGKHTGTDYAGQPGDIVYAVAGGEVVHASRMGGWGIAYGIHVIIRTEGLKYGTVHTAYCHLSHVNLDIIGKGKVEAGDIIGYVGMTGNTKAPHLHLEMRTSPFLYNNDTLNPELVLANKPPAKKVAKK